MRLRNKVSTGILIIILTISVFGGDTCLSTKAYAEEDESTISLQTEEMLESDHVPGELIVSCESDASFAEVEDAIQDESATVSEVLNDEDGKNIAVVKVEDQDAMAQTMETLQSNEDIEYVQPNYIYESLEDGVTTQSVQTNDAQVGKQWYLDRIGVNQAWNHVQSMQVNRVKVAVLDTGVQLDHPDLSNIIDRNLSVQIAKNGGITQLSGDVASNSHGTMMCGIIGAEVNNNIGIAGIGNGRDNNILDLFAVGVFYTDEKGKSVSDTATLCKGINYAVEKGARVINISSGAERSSDPVLKRACDNAVQAGAVLVCAAGNENTSDFFVPADFSSTIAVIASTSDNNRANFSNYGSRKDLSAPGESIYSTVRNGSYGYAKGTSLAAPEVTGVVALMLSVNSGLSPEAVKRILCNSATDIGAPGRDDQTGAGLVNAAAAVVVAGRKTGWDYLAGNWYYYRDNGTLQTSWLWWNGNWYYMAADGHMVTNIWLSDNGTWYYVNGQGKMLANSWLKSGSNWYYLAGNGSMKQNSWLWWNGNWYYMAADGHMATNTWLFDNGTWYYVNGQGKMLANSWLKSGSYWYYLAGNGSMKQNSWLWWNGNWYYMASDGHMVTNTWLTDGGNRYYIGADGTWIR